MLTSIDFAILSQFSFFMSLNNIYLNKVFISQFIDCLFKSVGAGKSAEYIGVR